LSPLDPFSFNSLIGLGLARFAAGHADEAVEWTRRAMREKVGMTWAYRDLATFLAAAGHLEEARDAARRLIEAQPYVNLASLRNTLAFMEPQLLGRYIDGLRQAGIPETSPA
jgi:adenylate cyclase